MRHALCACGERTARAQLRTKPSRAGPSRSARHALRAGLRGAFMASCREVAGAMSFEQLRVFSRRCAAIIETIALGPWYHIAALIAEPPVAAASWSSSGGRVRSTMGGRTTGAVYRAPRGARPGAARPPAVEGWRVLVEDNPRVARYTQGMVTISIDDKLAQELEALAKESGKSLDELAADSLRSVLKRQQYLRAIDEGLEDVKAGRVASADDVDAFLDDWSRSP